MRRYVFAAALVFPTALAAQLPRSSTRAIGMGGAYTALARGWETIAWNPAMLGVRGQPHLTIGLPQLSAEIGNNAFTISDIRDYADKDLSDADKQYLLDRIVNDDSTWIVRGDVQAHALGMSIGPMAFSYTASGFVSASANRDAVELMFNGNGGFSGTGDFFRLAGSGGDGWAVSTLAGSYAFPLNTGMGRLSVGFTGKYVMGSFLGTARDQGSIVTGDSVLASGQVLYTEYENGFEGMGLFKRSAGSGLAVDVGGALELSNSMIVSVALVNVFSTLSWDEDRLRYDRTDYTLRFGANGVVSDTSSQTTLRGAAIASDPAAAALRDTLLENADFSRLLRGGVAWRLAGFTLGGDMQVRLSQGLDRTPAFKMGVGAEKVLFGFWPLRAGFMSDFEETTAFTAGTGLKLGPVHLDLSGAAIMGTRHPGVIVGAGIGLIF